MYHKTNDRICSRKDADVIYFNLICDKASFQLLKKSGPN
jgi:hypothetical protein